MEDNKEIKAGSIVRLKSDINEYQLMTVEYISTPNARCVFIDSKYEIHKKDIALAALTLV